MEEKTNDTLQSHYKENTNGFKDMVEKLFNEPNNDKDGTVYYECLC